MHHDIVKKNSLVPILNSNTKDKRVWVITNNGEFSVKSATWIQNRGNNFGRSNLLKKMWKLTISRKVKMFAWLMINDRLQTNDWLIRFGNNINKSCPKCRMEDENIMHLFVKCQFGKSMWNLFSSHLNFSINNRKVNFHDWLETLNYCDGNELSDLS